MKHLDLTGELPTRTSLRSRTPLSILPSLFSWMRGRRVVDRGAGVQPSFRLPPVVPIVAELNAIIDERFGICHCPNCGEKVAVLVDGTCRDCSGDAA